MRICLALALFCCTTACGIGDPTQTFSAPIPLHAQEDTRDCSAEEVVSLPLTKAPVFNKYRKHIKHGAIVGARVKVAAIDPQNSSTRSTGTVSFVKPDGTRVKLFDYDIAARVGEELEVEVDPEGAEAFSKVAFSDPWEMTFATSGTGDGEVCRFAMIVEFDFELTMKISALVA